VSAKRGLGRGFDSLIPTELLDESFDPTAQQDDKVSDLRTIKISEIRPDDDQPRKHFDQTALDELSASIAVHGVIQPIVLTPRKAGGYTIVAGERRYRAASQAGLDKIPAIVRTLTDQHKLELSLIENLQRRNLNIIETATAYLKLRDQFNLSMTEIGERVGGKSQSAVSNTLRLLRLPENVKMLLVENKLTEGQVRPLIGLETEIVNEILPKIVNESWSARRIEQVIAAMRNSTADTATIKAVSSTPAAPVYEQESQVLARRFSLPVAISANQKGAGKVTITFKSKTELEALLKNLK
jgi:ParB family chromosome partitioning protein